MTQKYAFLCGFYRRGIFFLKTVDKKIFTVYTLYYREQYKTYKQYKKQWLKGEKYA